MFLRAPSAVAVVAVLLGGFAALGGPRPAYACSPTPDWNPVAEADVIVAGRITDIEIQGKTEVMTFLDPKMTFEVDRYLKGTGPATIEVFDSHSGVPPMGLIPNSSAFDRLDVRELNVDELGYEGGGVCGALDEDPRGRYWVVGFSRSPNGTLAMNLLLNFAIGDGPSDARVVERIAYVEEQLREVEIAPAPPLTGDGGLLAQQGGRSWQIVALSGLLAVLMLAATVRRVTR